MKESLISSVCPSGLYCPTRPALSGDAPITINNNLNNLLQLVSVRIGVCGMAKHRRRTDGHRVFPWKM